MVRHTLFIRNSPYYRQQYQFPRLHGMLCFISTSDIVPHFESKYSKWLACHKHLSRHIQTIKSRRYMCNISFYLSNIHNFLDSNMLISELTMPDAIMDQTQNCPSDRMVTVIKCTVRRYMNITSLFSYQLSEKYFSHAELIKNTSLERAWKVEYERVVFRNKFLQQALLYSFVLFSLIVHTYISSCLSLYAYLHICNRSLLAIARKKNAESVLFDQDWSFWWEIIWQDFALNE